MLNTSDPRNRTRRPSASTGKRVSALAIPAWLPLGGLLLVYRVETVCNGSI